MSKIIISVLGPTGIGKTKLAIELANYYQTEIISCDSRQLYYEMNIGTAVPSNEELQNVPHHFIGNLSVKDYYSIGQFEIEALSKIEELFIKNEVVILVGGSGMYEKAVVEGMNDLPPADETNQLQLEHLWKTEGLGKLQDLLKNLDPDYYSIVDRENPRRLLRALDIIWQTGKTYTQNIIDSKPERNFKTFRIILDAPREIIYERINTRVDIMMEKGLLEEVQTLQDYKNLVPLQTVGYSELFKYLDNEWTLEFAVEEIKKNSRRFAKRQLTWNKKLDKAVSLSYNYTWEDVVNILPLKY